MIKLIATILSAFSLFWVGLGAGIWYEGFRPAGWPNIQVKLGPLHWTAHLPDTPAIQLASLKSAEKKAGVRTVYIRVAQAKVSAQAATAETKAQAQIRIVYRDIIQKVPTYVTPAVDRDYPLSVGFLRTLDAGALGVDPARISIPAGQSDDSASPVASSVVAASAVDDFGICKANSERLGALQAWVRAQSAIDQTTPAGR